MKLGIMAGYSGATGRVLREANYDANTQWPYLFDPQAAGAVMVDG